MLNKIMIGISPDVRIVCPLYLRHRRGPSPPVGGLAGGEVGPGGGRSRGRAGSGRSWPRPPSHTAGMGKIRT